MASKQQSCRQSVHEHSQESKGEQPGKCQEQAHQDTHFAI